MTYLDAHNMHKLHMWRTYLDAHKLHMWRFWMLISYPCDVFGLWLHDMTNMRIVHISWAYFLRLSYLRWWRLRWFGTLADVTFTRHSSLKSELFYAPILAINVLPFGYGFGRFTTLAGIFQHAYIISRIIW